MSLTFKLNLSMYTFKYYKLCTVNNIRIENKLTKQKRLIPINKETLLQNFSLNQHGYSLHRFFLNMHAECLMSNSLHESLRIFSTLNSKQ